MKKLLNIVGAIAVVSVALFLVYIGLKEGRRPPTGAPQTSAMQPGPGDALRVEMRVRCDEAVHPISPRIYGIAAVVRKEHEEEHFWKMKPGARRWGGNSTSRFNWRLGNAWNTANDWYFMNVNYSVDEDYHWSRFLKENLQRGVATALTIPLLGHVAKDTSSYSFPVSVYGPQAATAPENKDAGNGEKPGGTRIASGDPRRTSVPFAAKDAAEWARRIRALGNELGAPLVHSYILGNEPMLWHDTHRDVRHSPLGYDELLERTIAVGSALRRVDPEAMIAGPAVWGWPAYFYSAIDVVGGLRLKKDRRAHGDVPLLAWYLQQLKAHEERTGERVLDLLDVHFYPQAKGVHAVDGGLDDPATAALRIRSTRGLWDPAYSDESWIGTTIRLLPRLQELIRDYYPGLRISIGEYSFGGERHMSGALAQAEALGRFGQFESVESAYYWTYPPAGSPAYNAFLAFRDYDSQGARFLDYSVPTESPPKTSLFASTDDERRKIVLIALNLEPDEDKLAAVETRACGEPVLGRVFRYAPGAVEIGLVEGGAEETGGGIEVELPAYSITIIELEASAVK